VDNTRLTSSLGWQYRWQQSYGRVGFGIGLQMQRHLARTHRKLTDALDPIRDEWPDSVDAQTGQPQRESFGLQTNNPGFPSYESEGWQFSGLLSLTLEH
jgi:hypothetical protein